jgi:hypothetical protein
MQSPLIRRCVDVGLGEVLPLEKKGLTQIPGQGVGHAVPEIQPGGVPALSIFLEGFVGQVRDLSRKVDYLYL